jgi:GAF domain-containing protein
VDGAGLMLADERGELRWATASDQQTQIVEEGQERLGQGPCVNAFAEHAPMAMRDAAKEPQWGKVTDVVTGQEMRAGLSVPVQLEGGPIGSLDLYAAAPRDWDQAEIGAAQVYAALAATLLSQAAAAQVRGRLADQLQVAFEHRNRIERAKGMLMVQGGSTTRPRSSACGVWLGPHGGRWSMSSTRCSAASGSPAHEAEAVEMTEEDQRTGTGLAT